MTATDVALVLCSAIFGASVGIIWAARREKRDCEERMALVRRYLGRGEWER